MSKKKAYVIGSNVSESLSPFIFNYWFEKLNINAEYTFKEIKIENFDEEIKHILKEKNLCGFNVTIPYKELIINKLNHTDLHSKKIGATNCVTKQNDKWVGKNTDWEGFLKPLFKYKNMNQNTFDEIPIVVGFGGAAKAIIYALQSQKFKGIKLFNRTYEKIKHLETDPQIKPLKLSKIKEHIGKNSLIINTTPIDIFSDLNNLGLDDQIGYDVVYKPKETPFLSCFKNDKKIYGIDMLVWQAAPCFEEWFGKKAVIDKKLFDLLEKQTS